MSPTIYRHVLSFERGPATRDVGALHRLVMSGYFHALSGGHDDARRRLNVLCLAQRPEPTQQHTYPPLARDTHKVLVQANTVGDWSHTDLPMGLTASAPITVDTAINDGDLIEVQGLLNPTRADPPTKRPDGTLTRGKRKVITDPNDVAAWFVRTLHGKGLDLNPEQVRVGAAQRLRGTREYGTSRGPLTFDVRHLRGVGKVTDAEAFTALLTEGVGRGRAYGAGLIRHRKLR